MKTLSSLALFLTVASTQAALITYTFDGTISGGLPHPTLPATIHPANTPFAGHFTYESTTPQISSTVTDATYALNELHLTFNPSTLPETVVISGGTIEVVNHPTFGDRWVINAGQGIPPSPAFTGGFSLDFHAIGLFYDDPSGGLFSNTNLPRADLTEASFPFPGSYIFSYSDAGSFGTFDADGTLDNLTSASVPEPSGTSLILGVLGLRLIRRRR